MSGRACNRSYQRYRIALFIICGYFISAMTSFVLGVFFNSDAVLAFGGKLVERMPELAIAVVAFWMGQAGHEALQGQKPGTREEVSNA